MTKDNNNKQQAGQRGLVSEIHTLGDSPEVYSSSFCFKILLLLQKDPALKMSLLLQFPINTRDEPIHFFHFDIDR